MKLSSSPWLAPVLRAPNARARKIDVSSVGVAALYGSPMTLQVTPPLVLRNTRPGDVPAPPMASPVECVGLIAKYPVSLTPLSCADHWPWLLIGTSTPGRTSPWPDGPVRLTPPSAWLLLGSSARKKSVETNVPLVPASTPDGPPSSGSRYW